MSRAKTQEYVLDDDDFEVLESEEQGTITSEAVKRKLERPGDPFIGPIDQDDFDKKGYTLSDYLVMDEEAYPRTLTERENLENAAALAVAAGAISLGFQFFTGEPVAASYFGGAAIGTTYMGYRSQEMNLDEAIDNSRDYWKEKLAQ